MLGFPILYFQGMRLMMFQLSSFCCRVQSSKEVLIYDTLQIKLAA